MAHLIVAAALVAQAATGRMHGRVLDPSGAVVPGAAVTLTRVETGATASTRADRVGSYRFDRLAPGDYVESVQASGFADAQTPATVGAGDDLVVDVTLSIAVQRHEIVVQAEPAGGATDPSSNANATIIKGKDLEALSDDPDELEAQLHALAGPAPGGSGGQIFVDGFSGGKLPPKGAIQEIRINQNPYSAEFDALGAGRIEIVTRPGSQTAHGRFLLDGNETALNSRDPFLPSKLDHRYGLAEASVSGPLWPSASFVVTGEFEDRRDISTVTATALDSSSNETAVREGVVAPRRLLDLTPRFDAQVSPRQTLSVRIRVDDDRESGNGVGQLALPSQAFDVRKTERDVQLTDLQTIGPALLNDSRFEYRRSSLAQTAASTAPQLTVPGAFVGGGNNAGDIAAVQQHVEAHDYVTTAVGAHTLRVGGRLRFTSASESSTRDFNGSYTFTSLAALQITVRGLAQGLSPSAIRAAGGGASQFTIAAGNPSASDRMVDVGLFAQDDWRVQPKLTISAGLRYETQNDIVVRPDFAPRAAIAWSVGSAAKGGSPWVLRAGAGLFYDRFPQTLALQTRHLDGTHTEQFVVASPDFFPTLPSLSSLAAARLAPTPYLIDAQLVAPRTLQVGATLERKIGGTSTVAIGYLQSRGSDQLFSRNIGWPPSASAAVASPAYDFESGGTSIDRQLTTNFNLRPRSWLSFNGYYVFSSARANTSGAGSFPTDPSNLDADEGRAAFDVRHRAVVFTGVDLPWIRLVPFITASSGQPFDITVGRDLNGDSIFNDRPAFATDPTRPSVVVTRFGTFDTAPIPGQTIIPRDFGDGPAQVSVNLRVTKPFVVYQHDTIRIDAVVSNLFNRANVSPPIGNLSSPLFGQSIGLANALAGGANRQIHLQLQFLF